MALTVAGTPFTSKTVIGIRHHCKRVRARGLTFGAGFRAGGNICTAGSGIALPRHRERQGAHRDRRSIDEMAHFSPMWIAVELRECGNLRQALVCARQRRERP